MEWLEPAGWLNRSSSAAGPGPGVTPGLTCGLDRGDFCNDLEQAVLDAAGETLLPAKRVTRIGAASGGKD